jgi:hypothetical protein
VKVQVLQKSAVRIRKNLIRNCDLTLSKFHFHFFHVWLDSFVWCVVDFILFIVILLFVPCNTSLIVFVGILF